MILVMSDRYRGAYCGGPWVCVEGIVDAMRIYDGGASGSDTSAGDFWRENDGDWFSVGNTPNDALQRFYAGSRGCRDPQERE